MTRAHIETPRFATAIWLEAPCRMREFLFFIFLQGGAAAAELAGVRVLNCGSVHGAGDFATHTAMPMSELERMRFLSRALEENLITGIEYEELAPRMRDSGLQTTTVEEDTPPTCNKRALAHDLALRVIEMAQTVERSHVVGSSPPVINGQPAARPPETAIPVPAPAVDNNDATSRRQATSSTSRRPERCGRFAFQTNGGNLAQSDPIQVRLARSAPMLVASWSFGGREA